MDVADISAACHVPPKFLAALIDVSWLHSDQEGIVIPNFDRWMSRGAKRRLSETMKKRRQRAAKPDKTTTSGVSRSCPDRVPILSRCKRDTNGTRGEERREELTSASADVEGCTETNAVASSSVPTSTGPPTEDVLMVFPCDGAVKTWTLTSAQVDRWRVAYPSLDIEAECRKALAWVEAHAERRKTARGMPQFLVRWFSRATDSPQRAFAGAGSGPPREIDWRKLL